jgi:hypothetical protein
VSGTLEEQNARLRGRLRELEFELRQCQAGVGGTTSGDEKTAALLRGLPGRAVDETTRFLRSTILAIAEQWRASADNVTRFANEVTFRNRTESAESVTGLSFTLSRDIYSAWVKALDRSLDIPSRSVRKFYEIYQEPPVHRKQEGRARIIIQEETPRV